MLRHSPFLLVALCSLLSLAPAAERRIAYQTEAGICVAGLDGSGAKKVAVGSDPEISPDGTRVAYTHSDDAGNRFIAVVDVAGGKQTIFRQIPGKNAYGPNWLPDGSAMTFSIFDGEIWHLGYVKADGTGFRHLRKAPDSNASIYGLAWIPDGSGFFAHDLDAIYRFDAEGKQQQKWPVSSLIPKGTFSSGGAMAVSPDGRTLLVEVDMEEPNPSKEDPGPPSAVWSVDPAAKKATRLTPKGIAYNASPRWISADEILFSSSGSKDRNGLIRQKLGSSSGQLIVRKATYPSVSRAEPAVAAAPAPAPASTSATEKAPGGSGIAKAPASAGEFKDLRAEWNRISDGETWKGVRHEMKKASKTQRHYAKGWFEGQELKMIMHVLADSDRDQTIRFYYYYEGALTSVFERRKGAHTQMSEVGEATETFNFVREKLVGWKRTGGGPDESWVEPKEAGFAERGAEVFKESLQVSGPLFKSVGAD